MTPYPDFVAAVYRREIDMYRRMASSARKLGSDAKARAYRCHYIYWRRRALAALRAHGASYRGVR